MWKRVLPLLACLVAFSSATRADDDGCRGRDVPRTSFVQFSSPNLAAPQTPLTIKGKLSLPFDGSLDPLCVRPRQGLPAVVILHGSSGIDSRGDFYQNALNAVGIATLQIDMWEARGVTSVANRPQAPILTYPDAFSALAFLATDPRFAADRIGVLGFSWGGVVSLASAEQLYAGSFGGGRKFAAHVANYPVCYGANNATIPALQPPAQKGTQLLHLTGAPVLIQIGSKDGYDNGTAHCMALAQSLNPTNNNSVEVAQYPGAYHGWDRIMIPVSGPDPFGNEGSYFTTGQLPNVEIRPDVAQAFSSRERVAQFFLRHLR